MIIKPQLASDAILEQVNFPCVVQPKIDGVRSLNLTSTLVGRSLDTFEGFGITDYFSRPDFIGFDGEMTLGSKPNCTDRLCSRTTGAMSRFKGVTEMADLHWWLFDLVLPETIEMPYRKRRDHLYRRVDKLRGTDRVHIVPMYEVGSLKHLQHYIAKFAEEGYEGTVIRNPDASCKPGRPTKKGQEFLRVKPWGDAEVLVTGITEGASNTNVAKTNSLGRTERSSAKAGLVPNGQVGSIQGTLLADYHCPLTNRLLFAEGLPITVSPGEMTVAEAKHYFKHPHEIVGHIVKFRHMTHGVKDLPRMPIYLSHRLKADL